MSDPKGDRLKHVEERKALKQKLWRIRYSVLGEPGFEDLDSEHIAIKERFETLPGFSGWAGFTTKWDIGDPYSVKQSSFAFGDADRRNYDRMAGKPYETIVDLSPAPLTEPMGFTTSRQRKWANPVQPTDEVEE